MDEREKQETAGIPQKQDSGSPAPQNTASDKREERKVFGIPFYIFQGGALGFAIGLILCGLIGIITKNENFNSPLLVVICTAAGGWLTKRFCPPDRRK